MRVVQQLGTRTEQEAAILQELGPEITPADVENAVAAASAQEEADREARRDQYALRTLTSIISSII